MKSNQEILKLFGKITAENVFDNNYRFIRNDIKDLAATEEYKNLFGNLTDSGKQEIEFYSSELLKGTIFDFLRIFEENTAFKIVYEEGGKQVNLVEISEMLKAEPIIPNGWIERFSQELKN